VTVYNNLQIVFSKFYKKTIISPFSRGPPVRASRTPRVPRTTVWETLCYCKEDVILFQMVYYIPKVKNCDLTPSTLSSEVSWMQNRNIGFSGKRVKTGFVQMDNINYYYYYCTYIAINRVP